MYAKSTVLLALFAASAQLVAATPPGCLIKAINTESEPANLSVMCGSHASNVQAAIRSFCGENTDVAMEAYKKVCADAGETVSTSSGSSSTSSSTASSASETGSDSGSAIITPGSASGTAAPYRIIYTTTYYDTKCSCTKTTSVSPTGEAGPTGFATGTGIPSPTGNGPSGSGSLSGSGAGSGPSATGSPISPNAPIGTGGAPFTGAASKSIGSFAAAGLALLGLAIAL